LLPLVSACLLACSQADAPIRIGLAGPLSDSAGAIMKRAADVAVEQINASGGIGGRPLELIARNDFDDPDSAVAVATALEKEGVVAVIGHVSSEATLAAAAIYNGAGTPVVQISPSASAAAITTAGDYTFRVCPSVSRQGEALARFVTERLGLQRGTILYLNNEYGRALRAAFAREFSRVGGRIDAIDPYLGSTPELGPYVQRLGRQKASQFVLLGGLAEDAVVAMRLARALGITVPFLGGEGLAGLEAAGPMAEGTYVSRGYLPNFYTPKNRDFLLAYLRKYPDAPPPNQPAAATYDILFLLRDVIAEVGPTRPRIRARVAEIGRGAPPFEGVTGEIAFDQHGDVPRQRVVIGVVEDGRLRAVEGL
jgi:branched-chain amino acid transport system substrate-binding protein